MTAAYNRQLSDALLSAFNSVLGQPKFSDDEIVNASREWMESQKKWPSPADLVEIITANRQRIFTREKQAQQIAYVEPFATRPTVAEKALYRYIWLSTGSRFPVSVAGLEEYALRVFKLDPSQLLSSHGNPIQGTLFGEPLPLNERWPDYGPPLAEKHYIDPWSRGAATGIGKAMPSPARSMSPREVFAERRKAQDEAAKGAA